jgi:thioesterase domain-containing protein
MLRGKMALAKPVELTKQMHEQIPLSKAMQIRVEKSSQKSVVVVAPLLPNINHKKTAFGGSVHSAAVLACWALVTEAVKDLDIDYVVIQDSKIDYVSPVTEDFTAESAWASLDDREKFLTTLEKRGAARAKLSAEVRTSKGVCAKLEGRFAAGVSGFRKSAAK